MFSGLAHINTASSRSFSHAVTFALDFAAFTNMVQFAVHKTNKARLGKPFWRKWGPFFCLVIATILADADLVRHLINDAWGTICMNADDNHSLQDCDENGHCSPLGAKYTKYCYSQPMMNMYDDHDHLTVVGWIFSVFCTWIGYFLLFVGVLWILSFPQKIRAQWRAIQRRRSSAVTTATQRTPLAAA